MFDINNKFENIAQSTNTTLEYNQKLWVLEVLLAQMSEILLQKDNLDFVFRGSLILRNWVFPTRRLVNDIDMLGTIPFDMEACQKIVVQAIDRLPKSSNITFYKEHLVKEKTWEETEDPGVRIHIPYSFLDQNNIVQIDFGFGDSIFPAPFIIDYRNLMGKQFKVPTVSAELALAWKVHGLFEFWDRGGSWTSKTLYDVDLILSHLKIDKTIFQKVLLTAFEERKTPLNTYERVLNQTFGRSKGSHRFWKIFKEKNGLIHVKENQIEIIEKHRNFLDQFFV